ncbi:hypothetical protein BN871_AI_01210 [Paenibacillus sp. P22]|nr:hypothetical protein BN871_AI_01210 [Paenibacillus sp. P22]
MAQDDLDDAGCLTAQGVRILRACRNDSDREAADDRVDLVRQADDGSRQGSRSQVAGEAGLVMLIDSPGHFFALAGFAGIVFAHDALQLGELVHHLSHEVEFADFSRADGIASGLRIRLQSFCDASGQLDDPADLVRYRAELFVIDDIFQLAESFGDRQLLVFVIEELRVGQAGSEHLLVAFGDVHERDGIPVAHRHEVGQQLAAAVQHREVALMLPHRGDQHLLRNFQEGGVERPEQHGRRFDEEQHFLQQIVLDGDRPAFFCSKRFDLFHDQLLALRDIGDDMLGAESFDITGGLFHCRLASKEAMSARHVAAADAGNFQRNDFASQQRNQPLDRTNEFEIVAAPAHVFGEGHRGQNAGEAFRQHRCRVGADAAFAGIDVFHSRKLLEEQSLGLHALAAGEADRRLAPVPLGILGDFTGWPFHVLMHVGLLFLHAFHKHGETPRSRVSVDVSMADSGIVQPFGRPVLQLVHGCAHEAGRHFLKTDLEQQILSHSAQLLSSAKGSRGVPAPPGKWPRRCGRGCGHA